MDAYFCQNRRYISIGIISLFLIIGGMLLPLRADAQLREVTQTLPTAVQSTQVASCHVCQPYYRGYYYYPRAYYYNYYRQGHAPYFYYTNPYRGW